MKGIAFITDPDGYWIEILSPKSMIPAVAAATSAPAADSGLEFSATNRGTCSRYRLPRAGRGA